MNLTTTFNAKNDVSKKYLEEETITPGTYSFNVYYLSTAGESGSSTVELNVLEPINTTTVDKDKTINWKDIVVPILVIGSIVLVLVLIFGRRRKRYRR